MTKAIPRLTHHSSYHLKRWRTSGASMLKMYLSQKKDISEGHYPFLLERKPDQVVTVELHQTQEQDLEFILSFVKLEQQYPKINSTVKTIPCQTLATNHISKIWQ
jgi:hypothetical protein